MKETAVVVNLSKTSIQMRRIYISYFEKEVIELEEKSQKIKQEIEEQSKNIWNFYFFKIDVTDSTSISYKLLSNQEYVYIRNDIDNIKEIINLLKSVSLHDDMVDCPSEIIMSPELFKLYDKIKRNR